MAAASAVEFARAAFIERDIDKAYCLLDPEAKGNVPRERFIEHITAMNSPTSPAVVTATEFEPIPGQEGMNIYLVGENGGEKFYYRLPMRESEGKGYKVVGVLRAKRESAPSESRQPLGVKRTTAR
jgi:hypothetical protein